MGAKFPYYVEPFALSNGRRVWVERFYLETTAYGVLCGSSRSIRARAPENVRQTAMRVFGNKAVLLPVAGGIDDDLPRFLAIAECHSAASKRGGLAAASHLLAAWFTDAVPTDIPGEVTYVLEMLGWEKYAEDVEDF